MKNIEKAAAELGGKAWVKGGKMRVYLRTQKGQTAYVEFDEILEQAEWESEPDQWFAGAALKVFTDTDGTSWKWKVNESKKTKHFWMERIGELLGLEVCADWREVIL